MSKHKKARPWSQTEIELAKALFEEKQMYREISIGMKSYGFNRSPEAIRKCLKRYKTTIECDIPDKYEHDDHVMEVKHIKTIRALEDKREKLFNIINNKYEKIGNPKGRLHKIVTISDLHIPWVNDNVIADMVSNHHDAEILVINGDFLDQFSVSKWPKNKEILLRHEYEIGMDYLLEFSKIFKKIVLTKGNHDNRLHSYFSANLDPGVSFLVHPDPLERMAKGYTFNDDGDLVKYYNFDNVYYKGGVASWYAKIGNCLFVHPSKYSKVPMRTAQFAAEFFWEKEDFDAIIVAHTHKIGKIIWKNKLLIEQGCACIPMDYEANAKMMYSQQAFGYAVVYMDKDGNVDFDRTRPVYYGTGSLVDADIDINIGD